MWNLENLELNGFSESLERLDAKRLELQKLRPFSTYALEKIKENLSIEWTYNSNSIEGNTLTLRETQMVLQEGITVRGKSLREHFETFNHNKAIIHLEKLVQTKASIRAIEILDLHSYVMNNLEEDFAGRLRNGGVRINGANFIPPNANKESDLFDDLIAFVSENPFKLHQVVLASIFHHRFVWIHPFFDGNGRTVRLAMNIILMRAGFPPAIILKTDRKKYYAALNNANNGNYEKLILLIVQALERTLNLYLNATSASENNYQEISKIVQDDAVAYGQEYVSLLARTGKIDAYKEGRNWFTSKDAVLNYVKNKKEL